MPTIAEVRQQYPQYNDMSDSDLANALHQKFYADMPKTDFDKKIGLPPVQRQPALSDAVTDIPSEIAGAFKEGYANLTAPANRGQQGSIEGLMNTGKAVLGAGQMLASPITGAARSLIGHPMAQAEHAVGTLIAPEIAAKDDPQKMYQNAKGDVDTAMTALASRGTPVAANQTVARTIPTISELKAAARLGYESQEVRGLQIKPESIRNYSTTAQVALNDAGIDENLAPKTFGVLAKLQKVPEGSSVTGNNINSLRRMLGNAAKSADSTEKAAAVAAIDHLDNFLPNISAGDVVAGDVGAAAKTLETARGNYAAAKQAENIDNKVIRAEQLADSANSGMNVANTIRRRMADVINPEKSQNSRGLTPDEIRQAETIASGTRGQNALRYAGNLLGGGGGLGSMVAAGTGAAATAHMGGIGAVLPVAGYALKSLSNKMTLSQAAKLSEAIRSRAPLASSFQKFEEKAGLLDGNRTSANLAAVVLAARNLATNLRGAGFNVAPSDLIGGLQSPGSGNAKDQQQIPRPPGQ